MAGRGKGPDFVEALARGLDVLCCFDERHARMSLSEIATITDLARPTARRLLLTLEELGYIRTEGASFMLAPRVLRLGMAYVSSLSLWDIAQNHLERLVSQTQESSSIAQLDGADIVYIGRVAVPKIIGLRVQIGTRFPALQTSQGKVLLAWLDAESLEHALSEASTSGLPPFPPRDRADLDAELVTIRARGWALADEELAPGIRSIAAPIRDRSGTVRAAMNVTVHAAETSVEVLVDKHLPDLLRTAGEISADWALSQSKPFAEVEVSGRDLPSIAGNVS